MSRMETLRKDRGYTEEQMALYLGISIDEYHQFEREPDELTVEQAFQICRLLGCGFELLFEAEVR